MSRIILGIISLSVLVYFIYSRYHYRKIFKKAEGKVISEGFENYYKNLSNQELINDYKDLTKEYRKLYREQKTNKINNEVRIAEIVCKMDFALPVIEERGLEKPEVEE